MDFTELNLTEEQQAAVNKFVQSETDKVRTKYSQDLKAANDELLKYKPAAKSQEQIDFETRLKALEDREKEISAKEQKQKVQNKLAELGIPTGIADYLHLETDEDIDKVGAELGNYFLENTAKPSSHRKSQSVTKEQFVKMSYGDRAKLFQENPELYHVLSKGK